MKRVITVQDKKNSIESYRNGGYSLRELGAKYHVHHSSIEKWIMLYDSFGEEGLKRSPHNRKYSNELKDEAVKAYLAGGQTMYQICKQYKLRSISVLQAWVSSNRKTGQEEEE